MNTVFFEVGGSIKDFDYKNNTIELNVPKELKKNIKKILITKVKIFEDINDKIADFLVNEGGILQSLSKEKMTWSDWKNLKESCKDCDNMTLENNGILMEFLCQYILPNIFDINILILYKDVSFESPEPGNDLLFFDMKGNVYIYEVKSKICDDFNHIQLKRKLKSAYTSLFCSKELKNHKKISIARETTTNLSLSNEIKEKLFLSLEKIEDVRNNIITLCEEKDIKLNLCIIGNGFDFTIEQLKDDLIEIINTSIYCKGNCEYNDKKNKKCTVNRLKKSIILNIISIEFDTKLDISTLNNNIVTIIEEKGLDVRC